jgi:hypothetical protein
MQGKCKPHESIEENRIPTQPVEEKYSRLTKMKNKEKAKSYAEVLKGMNHGQQESKKNEYNRDTSSRRPSTFRQKRSFNHDEGINRREDRDQSRHEFRRTTP